MAIPPPPLTADVRIARNFFLFLAMDYVINIDKRNEKLMSLLEAGELVTLIDYTLGKFLLMAIESQMGNNYFNICDRRKGLRNN